MEPVKTKYDNLWLGVSIGLVFPFFCYFCIWLFGKYSYMSFPYRYTEYLHIMQSLGDTVKLCTLANVLVFYLFLNRKKNNTVKGIVISTVAYLGLILYLMFFTEPNA